MGDRGDKRGGGGGGGGASKKRKYHVRPALPPTAILTAFASTIAEPP